MYMCNVDGMGQRLIIIRYNQRGNFKYGQINMGGPQGLPPPTYSKIPGVWGMFTVSGFVVTAVCFE